MHKFFLSTLMILCFQFLNINGQNDKSNIEPSWKNDSILTLAKMEVFFMGFMPPPTPYEERLIYLTGLIFESNFEDLEKLINYDSDYIKTYAFLAMCNNYLDKVEKNHKAIFKSKTPINIYGRDGNMTGETAGELTTNLYNEIKKYAPNPDNLSKLKKVIVDFIKKYALYPDSYIEGSYNSYQEAHMHLRVDHTFTIKNKMGISTTATYNIVVSDKFQIQAIEPTWAGTVSADPPKIADWLKEYGRDLTSKDSLDLRLKWK